MSQDLDQVGGISPASRASLLGRLVILVVALVAIVLSLYYFNESGKPTPAAVASVDNPSPAIVAQQPIASVAQHAKVTLTINTEIGALRTEFYPDKAPSAVAELIRLTQSGYFNIDTVLESRPGLGFVISKMGRGAKTFKENDEITGLRSRRGSIAISRSSVSGAFLNNLFFGYDAQPELEQQYIIIGQVLDGLDKIEISVPGVRYKVSGFELMDVVSAQEKSHDGVLREE